MACFRRSLNLNRAIMITVPQAEELSYHFRSRREILNGLNEYVRNEKEYDIVWGSLIKRIEHSADERISYSYVNYISRLMEDWRMGKELEVDTTKTQCVVCLAEDATYIARPCNHLILCGHCVRTFESYSCPVCRSSVTHTERVFD